MKAHSNSTGTLYFQQLVAHASLPRLQGRREAPSRVAFGARRVPGMRWQEISGEFAAQMPGLRGKGLSVKHDRVGPLHLPCL